MNKLPSNIKHIFFDLDHTLWDFETNSRNTFERIFKQNDLDINFNSFMDTYQPVNFYYWKLYREEKVSKADLRYGRLRDTFEQMNYDADDTLIELLAEEYIDYLPVSKALFTGAHEILRYLYPKYTMHIITNGFEEVQHKKMENAELLPFFDTIITSEEAGVKKPDKKIFQYALNKTGAVSEESIMIGDNFEADILGAMNAGIKAIYCRFNGEEAKNEVINVTGLSEIRQYL